MNGLTNSKKLLNPPAISIILTSVLLAGLSGCRSGVSLVPESVIVRDTVVVTKERILTDTLRLMKDTVVFQDRVKLEIKYQDSLVFVRATCPPDTIRINTVRVINNKVKEKSKFDKFVDNLSVLMLITFLLFIVIWIVRLTK